jgi:hypothetical protein
MEYSKYNFFTELTKELKDFKDTTITIAGESSTDNSVRYLSNQTGGYHFSQKKVLNLIDLYYNSKFDTGLLDSEGQRKLFLNITNFICSVAEKNTDIDVKNYVFIPDDSGSQWGSWLMSRQFKIWCRKHGFGTILNELNKDYSRYGTCVVKKVGKEIRRVPIRTLSNTQDAKSLKDAMQDGGYVIEEHEFTYEELKKFPDWNIDGIEYEGRRKVYERYAMCPESEVIVGGDDDKYVLVVAMLMPTKSNKKYQKKGEESGHILFKEVTDCPYAEAHWERQDGRWLGIGEVEKQFENQIARNLTANMRRRALLWGSKKIFQTMKDGVGKNLVKDVRDGDVMFVGESGEITQVAMESRNLAEFSADEQVWETNSKEKSFAFEVATGENMPSGTPFRLGVMLSNSVAQYYDLKKENLGLFLKEAFFELMIPIFIKETKNHTLTIPIYSSDSESLKQAMIEYHVGKRMMDSVLSGKFLPDRDMVKTLVEGELVKSPYMYIDVPTGFYKDVANHMELEITGEAQDTRQEIETLTTVYQSMVQAQDPRADNILQIILSKTGQNLTALVGEKPAVQRQPNTPAMQNGAIPSLPTNAPVAV